MKTSQSQASLLTKK